MHINHIHVYLGDSYLVLLPHGMLEAIVRMVGL